MKKILSIIFLSLIASSCSLAPFSATNTGQSLGAGKGNFEIGSANASYYMRFGYGISQNFDIGYVMEFGGFATSGIYTKYSFINNKTGPSLAMELGYGAADVSSYSYAGLVGSLAFGKSFELFINPRYNVVRTDEKDLDLNKTIGNVKVTDTDLKYFYLAAGMNVWFTQSIGMSLYIIKIEGDKIESANDSSTAAALITKF